MCGRFARYTPRKDFARLAGLPVDARPYGETIPSWNTAPGKACTLVRRQLDAEPEMVNFLWGLIPHWSKERPTTRPINARLETAAEKPMFRRVFNYRRCLVATDGWYEWVQTPDGKLPYFLCFRDHRPFFFGGLWDEWQGPDGIVPTFTILTRPALPEIAHVHDRMPVVLQPEHFSAWLSKEVTEHHQVEALCEPPDPGELFAYRVSAAVNRSDAEGPQLIEPVPA